jgi:hypothetical protein
VKTFLLIQVPVQIVLLLIAGVVGVVGGFILAVTAPLHSPAWVEELLCPPGTTVEVDSYESTTSSEPGMETLSVSCVDAEGTSYSAIEGNDPGFLALIGRFSAICVGVAFCPLSVLVLILGVFLARRRRPAPGSVPR